MKQLGNLAIVCAKRDDLSLTIYSGEITISIGSDPDKFHLTAKCDDDEAVRKITHELNHGLYKYGHYAGISI